MVFILHFVNVVYHIDYLHILKNPCTPGINHTCSWGTIILIYCWIQFPNIFLRIFMSMFIGDIGL